MIKNKYKPNLDELKEMRMKQNKVFLYDWIDKRSNKPRYFWRDVYVDLCKKIYIGSDLKKEREKCIENVWRCFESSFKRPVVSMGALEECYNEALESVLDECTG